MANLTSWCGRNEVDRFRNDIDRMFDDFFTGRPFGRSLKEGDWVPAVEMSDSQVTLRWERYPATPRPGRDR